MEFIYTMKNQGREVCIDQVREPEEIVVIPEELEHLPVTELGAYALAGSGAEEVYLPSKLQKIGAYAFYNCEKLKKISCSSRVNDLGTGVFAGARDVEALDFTLFEGEKSCLKDLLSELRQTLRVRIVEQSAEQKPESREARLIFPEYFEESVENTPARILFIETHGCGHRYRYCFVNRQFQYKDYDALFPHVKVQEPTELVTELALGRLMYPYGLTEKHRLMYLEYVAEHWLDAGKLLIEADRLGRRQVTNLDAGRLPWLVEKVIGAADSSAVPEEKLRKYIELAQQASDTEMVSWLMNFRYRKRMEAEEQTVPEPERTAEERTASGTERTAEERTVPEPERMAEGKMAVGKGSEAGRKKRRFEL